MGMPPNFIEFTPYVWQNTENVGVKSWKCGYCSVFVSNDRGWHTNGSGIVARSCPRCKGISMFPDSQIIPDSIPGHPVAGVAAEVADLYEEARKAAGAGAHTSSVMACRKLLMNIAVTEGAKEGWGSSSILLDP